jgi:hypothetical protein
VESKTKPILAKAIETTSEALIVITEAGSVSIPWGRCSERLARASLIERKRAELSPSGYGIHWPLVDEDLAVGALLTGIHVDEAEERLRGALRQAERRVQHAVCPIYGINDRGEPELLGSSILLKLPTRALLVTAAHVLDKNEHTTLYFGGTERLVELAGPSFRVPRPASGRLKDTLDFGFIDISDVAPDQWSRYRFVTPGDIDVDDLPVAHTLYAFVGYPETRNRPKLGRKFQLSTTAYVLVSSASTRYAALGLNQLTHFVGDFDRRKQFDSGKAVVAGPDPHGISGGGVWRMGGPSEFANGTNAEKLIGIGIEYRKSDRVLIGVRVGLVVSAILAAAPELARELPNSTRVHVKVTGPAENSDS